MSHVVLDGVTKVYAEHNAVVNFNLEIAQGEFIVLLGPSGCGKTTTLRCIAGLEEVSGGRIKIDGEVVSSRKEHLPPEKRQMGMVFQSYAVWPHMTVEQNIAFGLKLQKLSASEISQRVEEALVLVGLATHAKRAIHALSGGQQQRVALARAIALQPRVLLFDEPLSNLDAQLRERMRFDLRQLQQRLGITAIYVTHDQQEAMVIADRIVLMNAGRIVQIGTPRQIYREPATQFAANFVGQANSLNATVIEASETTTVRIDGGLLLTSLQTGFEIGERLRVVLRPEEILLSLDQSTGLNRVRTTVERCTFLGNIAEVWLNVGETQLRAQISPARDWEAGQIATLSIDPAAVSLVPLL